jgi:hypothetical protein
MTTTNTPAVPTVEVRTYTDPTLIAELELEHPHAIIVRRTGYAAAIVRTSAHRCGAEAVASLLRGALADAFLAGKVEAGADPAAVAAGTRCPR